MQQAHFTWHVVAQPAHEAHDLVKFFVCNADAHACASCLHTADDVVVCIALV